MAKREFGVRLKTVFEARMKGLRPKRCHRCGSGDLAISVAWKDGSKTYRCGGGHITIALDAG